MVSKSVVLSLLPVFQNKKELVSWRQSTNALMKKIIETHEEYESEYDLIYPLFDTGDIYSTCRSLWDFCKYELKYTAESEADQTVKSPAGILQPNEKIDCKHYSLFIGGVIGAIKDNEAEPWDWCYRFACYDGTKTVEHVFVVVKLPGQEIWIDPVLSSFDYHKKPSYFVDKKPMAVYKISGVSEPVKSATVGKRRAESDFLVLLNLNALSLKTLLQNNPAILNGSFKDWYITNGFDFDHLKVILYA